MTRPRPNLFVIGAAKCGTTSLHHHLARHPDIFMADPKEPGFFAEGFDGFPKEEEWYLGLFEEADRMRYRGESSTHYTKLPVYTGAAEGIARFCESPRFIYLMRDPIDRAISQYWHHVRQDAEFRSPLRAMRENPEYKAYGEYARQLKPYLDRFPADRIFTATFERLIRNPRDVTAEIFRWLSLDPEQAPEDFPAKNRAPEKIRRLVPGQRLGHFLHRSDAWDFLSPLIPQPLKDLGKGLATRVVYPSKSSMDDVVAHLQPWARDVVAEIGELLGREFPEWTTTLPSA